MSVAAARRLEPEWVDELPEQDARAQRSRRDLARGNRIKGNARIVASRLAPRMGRMAEIGAGDGTFALRITRLARPDKACLVDRQHLVTPDTVAAFAREGVCADVVQADGFAWLERSPGRFDAIVANLFLHHFDDDALRRLLALIAARSDRFVACEPRRSSLALSGSRMLGLLGCNDVTRHDAVASVRAGFRGSEISALWPGGEWVLEESGRGLFSHVFCARRA